MKIIKDLKQLYYINALEKGTNALSSIEDFDSMTKQLHKNLDHIDSLKDIFKTEPSFKKVIDSDPVINSQVKYVFSFNQYVQHFINKDFEEAFYLAFGLLNTSQNEIEKTWATNFAVDALGQIKQQYMKDDNWLQYNKRFHSVEEQLTKSSLDSFSTTLNCEKHVAKLSIQYHGINVGLAYLKFLEHDITQTEQLLNNQVSLFGMETVLNKEINHNDSIWFYESINKESNQLFNDFLVNSISKLSQKNIVQPKKS